MGQICVWKEEKKQKRRKGESNKSFVNEFNDG